MIYDVNTSGPGSRHDSRIFEVCSISTKGSFTNYIDKILAFFDHLPPCVDIFCSMNVDKKWTFLDHCTYLPGLVNVVCERPLYRNNQ